MVKYRLIYILILGILLLVTGCRSYKGDRYLEELSSVDSILFSDPLRAINKLDSIKITEMTDDNVYYYELLRIIAQENNFIKIKSDSTISLIYDYYKDEYKKDTTNYNVEYNYAKASLYFAIIKCNIKPKDTLVYSMFKEAQFIFEKEQEPSYYMAVTDSYLALMNSDSRDSNIAEYYYKRAFDGYSSMNNLQGVALLKVDRALAQLVSRRYDLTAKYLKEIEDEGLLLNDDIKYAYYTAYAAYYATQRDYASAVKCSKLKMELKSGVQKGIDYSKINYSVSKYYSYMDEVDSAVLYANMAADNALNSGIGSDRLHYYYRNIGDIYSKARLYYESSTAYRKAFIHSLNSNLEFHKKKQREVERKYVMSIKKRILEKREAEKRIIILFDVVIILILILLVVLLLYRIKISKATRKNMTLKHIALEQELLQTKSMIDVVSVSLGVLPSFIDRVNDLSAKVFSTDPNLYEVFQKEINSAKSETRKRLLNLVNNDLLVRTSPVLKYLDTLSNQEKMILLLLRQNYSIKYVASILNITQSSVRGSKVKIKMKIKEMDLNQEIKEDIMLGL